LIRAERAALCGDARLLRFCRVIKRYSVVRCNLAAVRTVRAMIDMAATIPDDGVSDGFRISSDPEARQADQSLADADRGKTRQILRKSATSRNQESDKEGA